MKKENRVKLKDVIATRVYDKDLLVAGKSGECQFLSGKNVVSTQLKGSHISCMRANPLAPTQIAFGSKDTTMQIWNLEDSGSLTQLWQAKNVPMDSLDLAIPIWDTDVAWLDGPTSLATCTAYCDVREYDFRKGRKCSINAKILDKVDTNRKNVRQTKPLPLTRILHSKINPFHVYVITQEGHPMLLDRRKNY